jgi:acetyltransferase-like isoleucine patch superfamily enzyme
MMGVGSYGSPNIRNYTGDGQPIVIGAGVSIADYVSLVPTGSNEPDWVTPLPFRARLEDEHLSSSGQNEVGNDVWNGSVSAISSSVTLADNPVSGAEAVVAYDVRPYAIAVENPAREVGRRFSDEQIAALQGIAWWTWTPEEVLERVADLNGLNVDEFIQKWSRRKSLS